MGGEKDTARLARGCKRGSPPRGRGKADYKGEIFMAKGITPAWAGKSHCSQCAGIQRGDHPRVGGEKSKTTLSHDTIWGSPPRGRGKGSGHRAECAVRRITPAWAGKSRSFGTLSAVAMGSPPRGRGKVASVPPVHGPSGITPAWAGKSSELFTFLLFCEDHPRVGGEKAAIFLAVCGPMGSPPRGRGKD